ncbi:MAG: c-type cytochrome domain-containing protein [Rubripirellula sp.]
MRRFASKLFCILILSVIASLCVRVTLAQEGASESVEVVSEEEIVISPLDEDGKLVQFERDIAPILRTQCLECHGPEDAKNDFRVDDREIMLDYIEPEDVESSMLYVDYLTIDDEDMLMPPLSHGGPLSASELSLMRVWIAEGADWPEDFAFSEATADVVEAEPEPAPETLPERVWVAQGFLHPATVHFPIALFMLGGAFVVLGWKWPSIGTQIPLACLLLGAATSVAATLMGWAFAPEQGYGSNWNILEWGREVDAHRWSAVIVTVLSVVFAIVALMALWKDSEKLTGVWKIGLLACAAAVGAVGHQGGEMSYGKDFYPKAWRILTGASEEPESVEAATSEASSSEAAEMQPTPANEETAELARGESTPG